MPISLDFQDKLLAALASRRARAECEVCANNNWAVIDQAVTLSLSDLSGNFVLPPPNIPCAGLVCNNCGNVRLFALGALGLLPRTPAGPPKE